MSALFWHRPAVFLVLYLSSSRPNFGEWIGRVSGTRIFGLAFPFLKCVGCETFLITFCEDIYNYEKHIKTHIQIIIVFYVASLSLHRFLGIFYSYMSDLDKLAAFGKEVSSTASIQLSFRKVKSPFCLFRHMLTFCFAKEKASFATVESSRCTDLQSDSV